MMFYEKMKKNISLIAVIFAAVSTFILVRVNFNYMAEFVPKYGVISIAVFIALSILYYNVMHTFNKKLFICMYPIGFIFSASWITGWIFAQLGYVTWRRLSMYLCILLLSFIFTGALSLAVIKLEKVVPFVNLKDNHTILNSWSFNYKSIFIVAGVLLIFWIPAFFAMFPGNYSYDAPNQVKQVLVYKALNSHHPVLHTLFLNGCLQLGNAIFNNYNAGVAVYSIIQAILMAFMESYACCYLKKLHMPNWLIALSVLFFALNPYNQILIFSVTKDVLFGGLFLIFILKCIDMFLFTDDFFSNYKKIISWCVVTMLMYFMRNQGIYVLLACMPFFIFALRKYWKKLGTMMLICILVYGIITGPVYQLCNITKGDFREALCVPMQQLARVVITPSSDITKEEKEKILELIPEDFIKQYEDYSADRVKDGFKTSVLKNDITGYVTLYLKLGIKNIGIYLDALYGTAYYNWFPESVSLFLFYEGVFMDEAKELFGIERHSLFPFYDKYLFYISNGIYITDFPVLSFFVSEAGPFWILIFCMGYSIYKKKYNIILVLLPILLYWVTVVLGPVSLMRYTYPLMLLLPLLAAFIMHLSKDSSLHFDRYTLERDKL